MTPIFLNFCWCGFFVAKVEQEGGGREGDGYGKMEERAREGERDGRREIGRRNGRKILKNGSGVVLIWIAIVVCGS